MTDSGGSLGEGWGNPVVGGTTLIRPAIQSPNFVTTVSGWIIRVDGTAEFNSVTIRNGQIISGTSLYYNGTPAAGNLFASISSVSGTDIFGNVFTAGIWGYTTTGARTGINSVGVLQIGAGLLDTAQLRINGNFLQIQVTDSAGTNTLQFPGPLNAGPLSYNGTGGLSVSGGPTALQALSALSAAITGAITAASAALSQAAAAVVLTLTRTVADVNDPVLQILSFAAGDNAIAAGVSGEANNRYRMNNDGTMRWGPGNATFDTDLYRGAAALLQTDSDFDIAQAGKGLRIKEGASARMGRSVLVAGQVTVANTSITAVTEVFCTGQIAGGTTGAVNCKSRIAGTSFLLVSTNNLDTGTVAWLLIEPG